MALDKKLRSTGPTTPVAMPTPRSCAGAPGSARASASRANSMASWSQQRPPHRKVAYRFPPRRRQPEISTGVLIRSSTASARRRHCLYRPGGRRVERQRLAGQRGPKQPGGVQRLQKIIMAGGGKAGFCCAGLLRRRGWPLAGGCWRGWAQWCAQPLAARNCSLECSSAQAAQRIGDV